MTTETMTVHKALSELKVIGDRILKQIDGSFYVTANKHSNKKIAGKSIEDFVRDMKSDFQSINDLIRRRNALKRAVVLSNAKQTVLVGGVEYTVAEAIEMKNHGMHYKEWLLNQMQEQNKVANAILNSHSGEAIEKAAEQYVLSFISSQPKDAKMGIDSEAAQAVRKAYIENNTYDRIDPLKIDEVMKKLQEEIDAFTVEVDAALSVSNAITTITIEY